MTNINDTFAEVIKTWRAADSQRMIFGVEMVQTQQAIKALVAALQKLFLQQSSFSLIMKDGKMHIVVKDRGAAPGAAPAHILFNIPSLEKMFGELKINSVTVNAGVTEEEMKAFFQCVSTPVHKIEPQGGVKKMLETAHVTHLKVDQLKYQLLRDEDTVTKSAKGAPGGPQAGGLALGGGTPVHITDGAWKDYFAGAIDLDAFTEKYPDAVAATFEDPRQVLKVLKGMIAKEQDTEKVLALYKERLAKLGFPSVTADTLLEKVRAPKKVLITEEELARLRRIEEEYKKGGGGGGPGEGEAVEMLKVVRKKLVEEAMRSEAILRQIGQGGIVLDKKGNILSVNPSAQKVLGLDDAHARGKSLKEVLKGHHLLTTVSDWQSESDKHTPKEVKIHAADEETLATIRESTVVIENENGRSIGILSALQNVVQQEELKKRKNDILDVLGHDLRGPLGAIKQNFAVLIASTNIESVCGPEQKKFIDNCRNNIERVGKLIDKIMDMRQLETGKIMLKFDTVKTNKLIEDAVFSLDQWAQNKKITLHVDAPPLPDIDGDPERLFQVIMNFVSNALKFTPEGGRITATGRAVTDTGVEWVEISVKDSGMGIDPEDLGRIFDKYEQVTINAPTGVSGLGLGLSICKTVVEMHGGKIWAESALGAGSTFIFRVPVKRSE